MLGLSSPRARHAGWLRTGSPPGNAPVSGAATPGCAPAASAGPFARVPPSSGMRANHRDHAFAFLASMRLPTAQAGGMPTWPRGSGYVGARAQTKPRADYAFAPDDENASRHPEPEGISAVRVALCEIDGPVTFSEPAVTVPTRPSTFSKDEFTFVCEECSGRCARSTSFSKISSTTVRPIPTPGTTSRLVRASSAICARCPTSSAWLPPIRLSVCRSPQPPARLANARIHWPGGGTLPDCRLGPPPGRGQKDH